MGLKLLPTVPIADKCIFKIVGYRINTQNPAAFLSTMTSKIRKETKQYHSQKPQNKQTTTKNLGIKLSERLLKST